MQLEECVDYFKGKPAYHRLFVAIKERYISLSRIGGKVTLSRLTEEEKQAFEGFFGKSFEVNKSAAIHILDFKKALETSRFHEISLEDLLQGYFEEPLITNSERVLTKRQEEERFFQGMVKRYKDTFSGKWLEEAYDRDLADYRYIKQKYNEHKEDMIYLLPLCMEAGNCLPVFHQEKIRFPVFATQISGNPHFFDEKTVPNRILMYITEYYYKMTGLKSIFNETYTKAAIEKRNEAFHGVGLIKDDISNYTLVYKINGKKRNGDIHQGMAGFAKEGEPVQVSLLSLSGLQSVSIDGNDIFVFENPMVFLELMEAGRPMVCTNGQPRLSTLVLLDLCVQSGYNLYYAGDFDVEGLLIAQNLKRRYPDHLFLWGYQKANYEKTVSDVKMSGMQYNKLKSVVIPELIEIKQLLNENQRAGYQETLIEDYRRKLLR